MAIKRKTLTCVSENADEAGEQTAIELTQRLAELAKTREQVVVALCGGSSPKPLYKALVQSFATLPEQYRAKLRFVPLDERCVPDSDPEHNLRLMSKQLIDPLIQVGAIVPWQTSWYHYLSDLPDKGLDAFSRGFQKLGGRIDAVIAGSGADGHIASLFPGHSALDIDTLEYILVDDSPKPPPQRISASKRLITFAPITVGIFLQGKEEAYKNFRTTHMIPEKGCPAKLLSEYSEEDADIDPVLLVMTDIT